MDPLVIDIPYLFRRFLVGAVIVPRRKFASSLLYKKVWDAKTGSPLLHFTQELTKKVSLRMPGHSVKMGMRYGDPSLAAAFAAFRAEGVREITVAPLYPQYSLAATESSIAEVRRIADGIDVKFLAPFYNDERYLDAVAAVSRPYLERAEFDRVLFSFHGLPERHVRKVDKSGGKHCLASRTCCDVITDVNRDCYRAQSIATAASLARRLGLEESRYLVGFQSRLNNRWIRPFSDDFYRDLPAQGVKRLVVISPSFVADCLETLEEVAIRGRKEFLEQGGTELSLVPSLNSENVWADALVSMLASVDGPITSRERTQRSAEPQSSHPTR